MASCQGVMLGIADEKISLEDDISSNWLTNKFGGLPNWMNNMPDVSPQCNACGTDQPMIVQIYCPLDNSSYHRVLYVFACIKNACWNNSKRWRVLRCQSFVKNEEYKETRVETKADVWCEDSEDWGEVYEEHASRKLEPLAEQTRNLKLMDKRETLPNTSTQQQKHNFNVPHFVPYYITVIEEFHLLSEGTELTKSERRLLEDYRAREGLTDIEGLMSTTGDWGGEKYELSVAKHGDKIFQKFKKKLSLCPNQCLRYSWNGEPLLMTSQSLGTIPSCNWCGEKRVFELQLMPALVSLLTIENMADKEIPTKIGESATLKNNTDCEFSNSDIEFGTVFIYTCSQGCWTEGAIFREEHVIVHCDPDLHLFKSAK